MPQLVALDFIVACEKGLLYAAESIASEITPDGVYITASLIKSVRNALRAKLGMELI